MRQLTTLDAQFLAVESTRTYGHVGGLAVYDPSTAPGGQLTVDDLCRLVGERVHLLPPLHWRLARVPFGVDLPYWVEDPDFDLDFHIRESAVPPPGDDRRVAETVARIFARPLDRSRPLWEIYVIHGLPEGQVALLTKIHHAVVDGVSGNEILSVLLDPSPEGRELPSDGAAVRRERVPGDLEMLGRGVLGLPRQPLRALRSIPTTLPNVTELPGVNAVPGGPALSRGVARARSALLRRDPRVLEVTTARPPRTPFNRPISPHRRFAFGRLSLDAVKELKNAARLTVNDVVVALCASAVREWLLARDALPRDPLVAMVPVSVRTEAERGAYGNRVSMMIVPVPTDEADPRVRLQRTHELLRGAKQRHKALPADLLTDATAFIPPAVAALAARTTMQLLGRTRPPVNLVISNVPGPRTPLYLAGAQLQANYPVSVIVDGVGLNITVMSYRDHLDFGIVADRDQVDDVWSMLDGLRHALAEFQEVAGTAAKPAAKPKGARARAKSSTP
jgi:diacylglycerol O-acyltransferase / wax synthase